LHNQYQRKCIFITLLVSCIYLACPQNRIQTLMDRVLCMLALCHCFLPIIIGFIFIPFVISIQGPQEPVGCEDTSVMQSCSAWKVSQNSFNVQKMTMVTQWKSYWCEKTPSRIICKYIISMTIFAWAIWLSLAVCLKYHSRQFHAPTPLLYAFSTQYLLMCPFLQGQD